MQIRLTTDCDGTPCDGKLSCTVWNGGKGRDNIKALPIVIVWGKTSQKVPNNVSQYQGSINSSQPSHLETLKCFAFTIKL